MSDLVTKPTLPAMSSEALDIVRRMESVVAALPQASFVLEDWLHAGMYVRMVTLPPSPYWGGALVQEDTVLIVIGEATIFTGGEPLHVRGVTVLPAAAGRKQAFVNETPITLIMMARTDAKTKRDAILHLCAEPEILREGV